MGAGSNPEARGLRELPAVHELAAALEAPHQLAVYAARRAIDEQREALRSGTGPVSVDLQARAAEIVRDLTAPSPRRVINATGVIVHTNLGRAPLARTAGEAVAEAAHGYSNLELELELGTRGSRHGHVEALLCELTGAEAATVVNNGAASVLLAAAALAGPGRAVVVSRGQLVEIGGGFRIPEVIAASGARMVEVGTTNRTRLSDYERALAGVDERELGAILRVHPSNFRSVGFVEDVSIEALTGLGVDVIDDVGSGVLSSSIGIPALGEEPSIRRSVAAGAALVCCSGDKLLGGPQGGLLVGRRVAVEAARRHPLARAMRIDKLSLAALQATLLLHLDPERARREVPVLAMLESSEGQLLARAEELARRVGDDAQLARAAAKVGGGALPLLELEGPVVAVRSGADPVAIAAALRQAEPPVVARIHDGQVLLDPRTIAEDEVELVARAVTRALDAVSR